MYGQSDSSTIEDPIIKELFSISLEDLLNMEVTVAGTNTTTLRETPGIITVITQNEIETSGARDMVDLLRTVPGFEFAGDIENTIALGVRGNYGIEGKILLLIDGQEINETGYGSIIWGSRFFLDNIKKIEIIRGPGSAIYGGIAELAVINIITKKGDDIDGAYLTSSYGISNNIRSRVNGQFGFGTEQLIKNLNISVTGSYSEANRSNETIDYATNFIDETNGASATQNYADSSLIKNLDLNLNLKYKSLTINAIYQDHSIEDNHSSANWLKFGGLYIGSKYELNITPKLKITPQIRWKKVDPWTYAGDLTATTYQFLATNYRTNEQITTQYEINKQLKLTLGTELYQDRAVKPSDTLLYNNNRSSISYSNLGAFGEILLSNKVANFIIGARFDNHSQFGNAFVPRFAITKTINKLHFKGLLSRAYKAPVIYNFEINPNIKPEFTNVAEIEAGYQFNDHIAVISNIFYTKIIDPIIYHYDGETFEEFYFNLDQASTIGAEIDVKVKHHWGYINMSYSYYKNNNTKAEPYLNQGLDDNLLNGFPAHKISIVSGIDIHKQLTISPTFIYNSQKTGFFYQEEFWEGYGPAIYDPSLIINLAIHYKINKNFKVTLAAYDLLKENHIAASAYDSGYQGTPFMGQEFTIKLYYQF